MPNLHPILVHFTIALFVTSILFDLIGYFADRETFKWAGRWNLILAGVIAIPTVITGLVAEASLPHTDEEHRLMEIHKTLGFIVLGTLSILAVWRALRRTPIGKMAGLYLVIGLGGIGVLTAGAYYGGEMVYTHGMGVAPMMAQMEAGHDHVGHAHGDSESAESPEQRMGLSVGAFYTCPMHPDVKSDTPGNCPQCGMTLQKVTSDDEHHETEMDEAEGMHETEEHSHGGDSHHDHSGHEH